MFCRSPMPSPAAVGIGSSSLSTGTDSPVSAASLTRRLGLSTSRASAATMSPASRTITSPGTSSVAATASSTPSRTTRAFGAVIVRSAAIACSARYSCANPISALSTTMAPITTASVGSPIATMIPAATSSTTIIVLANCVRNSRHAGSVGSSSSSFGPYAACRLATSERRRPREGSVPSCRASSATSPAHHLSVDVGAVTTPRCVRAPSLLRCRHPNPS